MGRSIDMEQKICGPLRCWTYYVTLNFDLTHDLGLSKSIFEKVLSQEWACRLTWNERACDLDLSRSNFETTVSQEWEGCGTKGMWVDRMLNPLCDLELLPWPWILEFWNNHISGMGGSIDIEVNRCETHYMMSNYDLDIRFSRSNFEITVPQEWEGRLTWNQGDGTKQLPGPIWLH